MDIGVIGAGASGMMAALAASSDERHNVTLFETRARCAKKLLATGNGRCNLTNTEMSEERYHGSSVGDAFGIIERFDEKAVREYFFSLGLLTVCEDGGRVYPYSDRANSVADVLRFALDRQKVELVTNSEIVSAKKIGEKFCLATANDEYFFDRIVICTGSPAGGNALGTRNGCALVESFGHTRTKLLPSLSRLIAGREIARQMKGVRADAELSLVYRGKPVAKSAGEIQFVEDGVSGPAAFELSREAAKRGRSCSLEIDLMRVMDEDTLCCELVRRAKKFGDLPMSELLTGLLQNRVGRTLVKLSGLSLDDPCSSLNEGAAARVADIVKQLTLDIEGIAPMDDAQVCAGGVPLAEFDPMTLESRLVPGLFAAGETLDVDGDCGGYNLQWAWSSGRLAGMSAAEEKRC